MPDEAPVAAPEAAPAPEAPAAAPANESFEQKMERLGGFSEGDAEPEVAPDEPAAEPEPAAANTGAKSPPVQLDPKLDALQKMAQELGFEFEGQKVTVGERADLRRERRELREQLEKERREALAKLEQDRTSFATDRERADKLLKAADAGDYEALAQALGRKDWDDLQKDVIAKIADPHYKRLRELEQKQAERDAAEAKSKQETEERERQQAEQQRHAANIGHLRGAMKASKDPLLAALHHDPTTDTTGGLSAMLQQSIYQVQLANFDGKTTVTPEQALNMTVPGGHTPIRKVLENWRDALNAALGPAKPANDTKAEPAKKPAPKTAPTPRPEPAAPGRARDDGEWRKRFGSRMAEAIAEDDREEVRQRQNGRA